MIMILMMMMIVQQQQNNNNNNQIACLRIQLGINGTSVATRKWFPLRGERAHCLKLFCMHR